MYQQLRSKLRNVTIHKRLTYAFFLLSLIPILIVGGVGTRIAYKAIVNKSINYIVQIVDQVEDDLQNELESYETLLNELMINAAVQKVFKEYNSATYAQKAILTDEITKMIIPKLSFNPYIRDIKIINLEDKVIYQRGYLLNDEDHVKAMTTSIKEIGGKVQCFMQPIYGKNYIVMSKEINSVYSKQKVGYVMMILKEEAVRVIYEQINLGEGSNIYLTDALQQNLSVQFPNKNNIVDEPFYNKIRQKQLQEHTCFNYKGKRDCYTVISDKVGKYNMKLVGIVPHSYLLKEIMQIIRQIILIVVGCFILSIIVSKIICRSIIEPLDKLKQYILSAMKEKFNTEFVDDSPDELGVLGRNFVQINNEMYEMIKKIEKDEKDRRELEMNMLQAQINPHFLFNTLNSLRWICMMSGADSASEGILALSDLLKNTIIKKSEYVTIENELQNVNNYMLIQKLRYGDSFKLEIDVKEELLKCQILKFILQPIVENAIIHGIKEDESILNIKISIEENERDLVFEISDDGKGFDTAQMLYGEKKDIKLSGIGINNVKDRIRLHFGEDYGVEIQSKINKGTTIILHIPKMGEL